MYDCWAGGVIGPGEPPAVAAARELAEELGIDGVALMTPHEPFAYEGLGLRYHVFTYEIRWDGPLRHQPEEIVWGAWVTLDELRARLAEPRRWPFVPDGRMGIELWLAARDAGLTD
jgi:8-oxo-dGTP pyrophosphatase MutT (NUDIX family)